MEAFVTWLVKPAPSQDSVLLRNLDWNNDHLMNSGPVVPPTTLKSWFS